MKVRPDRKAAELNESATLRIPAEGIADMKVSTGMKSSGGYESSGATGNRRVYGSKSIGALYRVGSIYHGRCTGCKAQRSPTTLETRDLNLVFKFPDRVSEFVAARYGVLADCSRIKGHQLKSS
jgi:hypothetical protein